MNEGPHGWALRNQATTLPVYEANAEHFHEWSFVPNGVAIDWRIQSWRVLRYCTLCDEFQNVTVPLDNA